MPTQTLEQILQQIQSSTHPPIEKWDPPLTGEMDMRIAPNGSWYYQGSKINRQSMVNLFSTILKKQDQDYFLVTPVEKYKIQVDDAPFVAIELDQYDEDPSVLVFRTNVDENIIADNKHAIFIRRDRKTQQDKLYLHVRDGLEALLHRNVYYQIIELAEPRVSATQTSLVISSQGHEFMLGQF